jgi:hypothetical protein
MVEIPVYKNGELSFEELAKGLFLWITLLKY